MRASKAAQLCSAVFMEIRNAAFGDPFTNGLPFALSCNCRGRIPESPYIQRALAYRFSDGVSEFSRRFCGKSVYTDTRTSFRLNVFRMTKYYFFILTLYHQIKLILHGRTWVIEVPEPCHGARHLLADVYYRTPSILRHEEKMRRDSICRLRRLRSCGICPQADNRPCYMPGHTGNERTTEGAHAGLHSLQADHAAPAG